MDISAHYQMMCQAIEAEVGGDLHASPVRAIHNCVEHLFPLPLPAVRDLAQHAESQYGILFHQLSSSAHTAESPSLHKLHILFRVKQVVKSVVMSREQIEEVERLGEVTEDNCDARFEALLKVPPAYRDIQLQPLIHYYLRTRRMEEATRAVQSLTRPENQRFFRLALELRNACFSQLADWVIKTMREGDLNAGLSLKNLLQFHSIEELKALRVEGRLVVSRPFSESFLAWAESQGWRPSGRILEFNSIVDLCLEQLLEQKGAADSPRMAHSDADSDSSGSSGSGRYGQERL